MIGAQFPQPDPRGWLTIMSLPDDLQDAEDSTAHMDRERRRTGAAPEIVWGTTDPDELEQLQAAAAQILKAAGLGPWTQVRPATSTERILLEHLGHTLPPEGELLLTVITWPSNSVRQRRWPQLQTTE